MRSSNEKKWPFVSSVLLDKKRFDPEKLRIDLLRDWEIDITEAIKKDPNSIVFEYEGMLCTISYMPARVPHNEAGEAARYNTLFSGAVRVANTHKAHILIAIIGRRQPPKEMGKILVKLSASCLNQEFATGIYTVGTVFEPSFYKKAAYSAFANGQYPVANLILMEVFSHDGGKTSCIDTYGLKAFKKDEMRVLDSDRTPQELMTLILDISFWLIETDGSLIDGETFEYRNGVLVSVKRTEDTDTGISFMDLACRYKGKEI